MRFVCIVTLTFWIHLSSMAQPPADSEISDSLVLKPLLDKIGTYFFQNADSSLYYAEKILTIANESRDYAVVNFALQIAGEAYRGKGEFPRSLEMQLRALRMNRLRMDRRREAQTLSFIGFTYLQSGNYEEALLSLLPAKPVLESTKDLIQASFTASNTGHCYTMLGRMDSAHMFNRESMRLLQLSDDKDFRKAALRTLIYNRLGNASEKEGKLHEAAAYYHQLLYLAFRDSVKINVTAGQKLLANVFMKQNKYDSAIYFARNAILSSRLDKQKLHSIDAAMILAAIYKKQSKPDSALYFQSMAMELKDSVYWLDKFSDLQRLTLNEQKRQQELEVEKASLRSHQRMLLMAVVAIALLVVSLIQRRNNRLKQAINKQLEEQKANLEKTLVELKSTQAQLVQSEKMASLGELTAGIAHEIQNPLNFVNNFSEVNTELIDELELEIAKGNLEDAKAIAKDVRENEIKINHHGKRADAIVKGMLQHTRSATTGKEPADLNKLVDEYLRLSYHGFRAKDKSFNAVLNTDFDGSLQNINIIPQEIGRALLNLMSNAFYAVAEKSVKTGNYEPIVTVSTRQLDGVVQVSVKDNGNGIPDEIVNKIFQPFFTTKPTGQGTGLGLSLCYDIVKAHGGELKVESKEGEGSEFVIQLPVV
ncbi:ATP-binding protein [Flavihumibacter fluvii]|uniref:ATP-binding protein n=1 Tax=Flavihumibacter fluvii TaxID=2838157 RepID=UPI001EFB946A|nr:ATP-binding protein [Flavihumibacter fluvii]ULQ52760.1 ATP-binding protein [Flavihumibacter fluvii]